MTDTPNTTTATTATTAAMAGINAAEPAVGGCIEGVCCEAKQVQEGEEEEGAICEAQAELECLIMHLELLEIPLAEQISPILHTQMSEFVLACKLEAEFIGLAATAQKPTDQCAREIAKPLLLCIERIVGYRNRCRGVFELPCILSLCEAALCLNWIFVETPVSFLEDMFPGTEYYTNRAIVQSRDKDPAMVEWANGFTSFLRELTDYVRLFHPTGVTWNPEGDVITPAPEEPSEACTDERNSTEHESASSRVYKFKAIDRTPSKPTIPRCEKKGRKWIVENQNATELRIFSTNQNENVSIFSCKDSNILVENKVHTVSIGKCTNCAVIVQQGVLSSVDIYDSSSIQLQIKKKAPSILVDRSSCVTLWLGEEAREAAPTEITTCVSSSVNISIPNSYITEEVLELPIPEQVRSIVFQGGKLFSECVKHS
ncbi:cyclase associated protein [Pelomyxa schiedti]|nr:cyclase associated protein [Pelomyxa schiedti]